MSLECLFEPPINEADLINVWETVARTNSLTYLTLIHKEKRYYPHICGSGICGGGGEPYRGTIQAKDKIFEFSVETKAGLITKLKFYGLMLPSTKERAKNIIQEIEKEYQSYLARRKLSSDSHSGTHIFEKIISQK